ncbi:Serine/threonine-protein kinase SRPK like [Verticillium longisporum]|nr:Serine/threonine-protein kinase SRPK like [Verticillium longisporum]
MAFLTKLVRKSFRRTPSFPLHFPSTGFPLVSDSILLEEEHLDEYKAGQYYPANIGDVYDERYQVLGKLGFGSTSTVWLARNLQEHQYVALKIYTRDGGDLEEFQMYEALGQGNHSHPGYPHVRTALDTFKINRPDGSGVQHHCLVQKPMWDSWRDVVRWNPAGLFSEELLKAGLAKMFLALDYLHSECKIVHTDIKADNIMMELVDESVLAAFTQSEIDHPSPRKFVDGAPIYLSRQSGRPRQFGNVVLGDFGAAVRGDKKRNHDAQPNVYRSPEVMLKTEWSYPADIWNVGVMIWDLFEGTHLFQGNDPKENRYLTRAHLAELVALLGPPPTDLLRRGKRSSEFFAEDGEWKGDIPIPQLMSFEKSVTRLEGEKKEAFLGFVNGMLQWRPEDRKTARQLHDDPWLRS